MSCTVLGKQTSGLFLEIMIENTQLTYLILWCHLLWQPEQNKCSLVSSGFHAFLSVLNHVPAMFAYLPEKLSGWKAKLQNTWGQELKQLLLQFHYRSGLRKNFAVSCSSVGSAGSESKRISLAGWWYLHVITHCAKVCNLLFLFHLAWERKDGSRNGKKNITGKV